MTRGKYAAKAANRTANLDNELLQNKIQELASLKDELAKVQTALQVERVDRMAEVLQRADELSSKQIEGVQKKLQSIESEHRNTMREVAEALGELFKSRSFVSFDYDTEILPRLIPSQIERSDYLERFQLKGVVANRRERRHAAEYIERGLAAKESADNKVKVDNAARRV